MKVGYQVVIQLFFILLLFTVSTTADISTIPERGTVYIGEEGLDITACGVFQGDTIGWWSEGRQTTNEPSDLITISDPTSFYISPILFTDKTGPWYSYPDAQLAFYVKEPKLAIRVMDSTADFDATGKWVPTGQTIGFRLENNLYDMINRPGVDGAPFDISIITPDGLEYSSVDGYRLNAILVDSSPYETGGVWNTAGQEAGYYAIQAKCTANQMDENNKKPGAACSEIVQVQIQSVNPLIKDFSRPDEMIDLSDVQEEPDTSLTPQSLPSSLDRDSMSRTQSESEKTELYSPPSSDIITSTPSVPPELLPLSEIIDDYPTPDDTVNLKNQDQRTEPVTRTQGPAPAPTTTSPGYSFFLAVGGIMIALFLCAWKR